jgi:hypothetical protein
MGPTPISFISSFLSLTVIVHSYFLLSSAFFEEQSPEKEISYPKRRPANPVQLAAPGLPLQVFGLVLLSI